MVEVWIYRCASRDDAIRSALEAVGADKPPAFGPVAFLLEGVE
jgi:hypothetical protein